MKSSTFKDTPQLKKRTCQSSLKMGEQKRFLEISRVILSSETLLFDVQIGKPREWNSHLTQQIEGAGKKQFIKRAENFVSKIQKMNGIIENK